MKQARMFDRVNVQAERDRAHTIADLAAAGIFWGFRRNHCGKFLELTEDDRRRTGAGRPVPGAPDLWMLPQDDPAWDQPENRRVPPMLRTRGNDACYPEPTDAEIRAALEEYQVKRRDRSPRVVAESPFACPADDQADAATRAASLQIQADSLRKSSRR